MILSSKEIIDYNAIIEDLESKHYRINWKFIDNNLYVYKPLGRKDYTDIIADGDSSVYDKEDQVVLKSILYPKLDEDALDDLDAGIVSVLAKDIMDKSYLSSIETRERLTEFFRREMDSTDNQVTCMINEAFPQYDIEEIENWGLERTAKYFSRAEWKLVNLRNIPISYESVEPEADQEEEVTRQEPVRDTQVNKKPESNSKKLTPEKLAELKRKFPDIDWANDDVMKNGIDGMATESVSTVPVALRPFGK